MEKIARSEPFNNNGGQDLHHHQQQSLYQQEHQDAHYQFGTKVSHSIHKIRNARRKPENCFTIEPNLILALNLDVSVQLVYVMSSRRSRVLSCVCSQTFLSITQSVGRLSQGCCMDLHVSTSVRIRLSSLFTTSFTPTISTTLSCLSKCHVLQQNLPVLIPRCRPRCIVSIFQAKDFLFFSPNACFCFFGQTFHRRSL